MRAMFVNTIEPVCGVRQFGINLFTILRHRDRRIEWWYAECHSYENLIASFNHCTPDVIVYNWAPLIGGYLSGAPFHLPVKQVLVYHDGDVAGNWNAILFADPTMPSHDNWHPIGRPIPEWKQTPRYLAAKGLAIGVHGFLGAWSDRVVTQVIKEFEYATVQLLLPFARYGDADGRKAMSIVSRCQELTSGTGVNLSVRHDFLPQNELLEWLAQNSLNCYLRPPEMTWRGVSSAPDCALAVRRPIAISHCNAFRHLHGTTPSICVEDSSLKDIISHGLSPLVPLYDKWSAENVRKQVEDILLAL